jgi:hypothetical protein
MKKEYYITSISGINIRIEFPLKKVNATMTFEEFLEVIDDYCTEEEVERILNEIKLKEREYNLNLLNGK